MQTPDATGTAPTIAETLAKLGADDKTGLTDAEIQARLKKYGPNALVEKQKNAGTATKSRISAETGTLWRGARLGDIRRGRVRPRQSRAQ